MSNPNLRQVIQQEYIKCAQDPVHFMKKYCFIQHPQQGRILFHLYPFQEKVLHLWKDNPYSVILKSRQLVEEKRLLIDLRHYSLLLL